MDTNILATIISSSLTLIGVIITVIVSSSKTKTATELRVKAQQHQIEEMKNDIKEHNNYAHHIPVIESQIETIKESITEIKNKIGA